MRIVELFDWLNDLWQVVEVEIFHVKGHAGIDINEKVDKLADKGAKLAEQLGSCGELEPMEYETFKKLLKQRINNNRIQQLIKIEEEGVYDNKTKKIEESLTTKFYRRTSDNFKNTATYANDMERWVEVRINQLQVGHC